VGCYIWYSEEGPGWGAALPSLIAVPTAHQIYVIRRGTIITFALRRVNHNLVTLCVVYIVVVYR